MGKTVQITQELLSDLFLYFLQGERNEVIETDIKAALEVKLDAIIKHELYTLSKTADTSEKREAARQAYLDKIGMRESFRWVEGYTGKPERLEE